MSSLSFQISMNSSKVYWRDITYSTGPLATKANISPKEREGEKGSIQERRSHPDRPDKRRCPLLDGLDV
jgi:hypothetical protein